MRFCRQERIPAEHGRALIDGTTPQLGATFELVFDCQFSLHGMEGGVIDVEYRITRSGGIVVSWWSTRAHAGTPTHPLNSLSLNAQIKWLHGTARLPR
jgi:hypothetical protein